jgi:MFS family permease
LARPLAFWLVGATLGVLMFAASAPSPLYGISQERWHFSATTLTAVFAVYALALLATLLVCGPLSDHVGRRPVIFAALLIEAGAMICFLLAGGVGALFTARVLQGTRQVRPQAR